MSRNLIESKIKNFLETSEPQGMAIRGRWGIGKTYLCQKTIENYSKEKKIKCKYISLSNVASIEDFKTTLLLSKNIGLKRSAAENFKTIWMFFKKDGFNKKKEICVAIIKYLRSLFVDYLWSPTWEFIKKIFSSGSIDLKYIKFGVKPNVLADILLDDVIIWVDDIERKNKNLDLNDIFGFLSYLKEQKKCRIICILNEDRLRSEDEVTYKEINEKLFEINLEFQLETYEIFDLVFEVDCCKNTTNKDRFYAKLKPFVLLMDVKNIRILRKIKISSDDLFEKNICSNEEVLNEILKSLVLFSCAHFDNTKVYPSTEFLLNYNTFDFNNTKDHDKWSGLLTKYQYSMTGDVDQIIFECVKNGYINPDKFNPIIDNIEAENLKITVNNEMKECYKLFRGSFKNNIEDFSNALLYLLSKRIAIIEIHPFDSAISMLERLGKHEMANNLVDKFLKFQKKYFANILIDQEMFLESLESKILIEKIRGKIEFLKPRNNFAHIMLAVAKNRQWDKVDIEYLKNMNDEEFTRNIEQLEGDYLQEAVKGCLLAPDELIGDKTKKALDKIGNSSLLNKIRVEVITNQVV